MSRAARLNALWLLATFLIALAVVALSGDSEAGRAFGVLVLAGGLRVVFLAQRSQGWR